MAKQTPADRLNRLAEGRCPIHGIAMSQVGNAVVDGKTRFVAECTRNDCNVQATTHEPFAPAVLLPEFEYLLKES